MRRNIVAFYPRAAAQGNESFQSVRDRVAGAVAPACQSGSHSRRVPFLNRSRVSPAALTPIAHSSPQGARPLTAMTPAWII
jgi:hypothetical protein